MRPASVMAQEFSRSTRGAPRPLQAFCDNPSFPRPPFFMRRTFLALLATLAIAGADADAQAPAARRPDPVALLAAAKQASGGAAWDPLRTQRSEVRLAVANV